MKISYAIMTHPSRAEMAEELRARLERIRPRGVSYLGTAVDELGEGPWASCRKAWELGRHGFCEYHLVLQDDVIPCRDFLQAAKYLLSATPTPMDAQPPAVTFFANRKLVPDAMAAGASWVRITDFLQGPAIALPKRCVGDMLRWVEENEPSHKWGTVDDARIWDYLKAAKVPVLATVPSLVDHRKGPSLVGHSSHNTASVFIGADEPAIGIPWNRTIYEPPPKPRQTRKKRSV